MKLQFKVSGTLVATINSPKSEEQALGRAKRGADTMDAPRPAQG
jgi:hypothetical protein